MRARFGQDWLARLIRMNTLIQHIALYETPAQVAFLAYVAAFLYISAVDVRTRTIPHAGLAWAVAAWACAAAYALVCNALPPVWDMPYAGMAGPQSQALCVWGLAGGFFMAVFSLVSMAVMNCLLHQDSLGMGDVKLLAVVGLYTGPMLALGVLACGCVFAVFYSLASKQKTFPFAPFLFLAMLLCAFALI